MGITQNISDEELVRLYLEKQESWTFDKLYTRYSGKVYGKCISLLKNHEEAEDALQDIFTKVLLNLSKFSFKSRFSTWIYSITYNYCIDLIRRRKKNILTASENIENMDMEDEIGDKFLLEVKLERLKVIMEEVPTDDKTIILMKYQDGMSIKEIGAILDKSDSAVKMKLKRAKHKFRKIYQEMYSD